MNYLDANFATALHFDIRGQSEVAEKFVRKNSAAFLFSELAELECLSFDNDSNARVLAASCRLKVYPELTAAGKGACASIILARKFAPTFNV